MRKNIIYLLMVLIIGCSSHKSKEQEWKKTEVKLKEIRCSRDRLIANEELRRGNLIAFFDNIEPSLFTEYQYYLFKKYNLICRTDDAHYFGCQKSIMDSIIFIKYGKDFYDRIKNEVKIYFNNRNDNFTTEGYYFTRGMSHYQGGLDSIYSYIDINLPKIIDCQIDTSLNKDAVILIYVNTSGRINNIEIKKKICPEFDRKIVELLSKLPKKFDVPLIDDKKQPIIEEIYLKW